MNQTWTLLSQSSTSCIHINFHDSKSELNQHFNNGGIENLPNKRIKHNAKSMEGARLESRKGRGKINLKQFAIGDSRWGTWAMISGPHGGGRWRMMIRVEREKRILDLDFWWLYAIVLWKLMKIGKAFWWFCSFWSLRIVIFYLFFNPK